MGIINVTPDSFADGGVRFDPARAVADGLAMVAGRRGHPGRRRRVDAAGREPVRLDEELRRVLPVVERLAGAGVPLSIDTYKAAVAREAHCPRRRRSSTTSAACNTTSNWRQSSPRRARRLCSCTTAGGRRRHVLRSGLRRCDCGGGRGIAAGDRRAREAAGIPREAIILDPGLGFAKRAEHTWAALAGLDGSQA